MLLKFECCKQELTDARDENVFFFFYDDLANIVSLKDKILSYKYAIFKRTNAYTRYKATDKLCTMNTFGQF